MDAQLAEMAPHNGRHLIRISVRDTGIGIPEDRTDRLFQSFSQVDASTNRRYGGTGLGLAICKRLVEMMGGEIRVESRAGEGTTFEFTFSAGIAASAEPAAVAAGSENPRGLKILVAEDNKVNQIVTVRMLQKMGYQVDLACDGASAISRVEANPYDIVLMDLNMPGIDGLEAAKRIRLMPTAQSSVPIVALTASATDEDRSRCLAAGMNDYLSKPIEIHALRRALDRWGNGSAAGITPNGMPSASDALPVIADP
jgi:CheY-like chemotaxis protein